MLNGEFIAEINIFLRVKLTKPAIYLFDSGVAGTTSFESFLRFTTIILYFSL